jgi:isoleucyl-tRNA synthetase
MKANLPVKEVEIQSFWEKIGLYGQIRQNRQNSQKYILHDGPPYANESIHVGTALNKILKDFIVKFKTMSGFDSPYVPGWDCHGLPIELRAMKTSGDNTEKLSPLKIRQKCRRHAEKFINVQRKEFKRLGVLGEWDNPYLTMSPDYEAAEIEIFKKLWSEGYVYRGLRPIHWCGSCRTALADAETEYCDKTSPSIYVKFSLIDAFEELRGKKVSLLVWTTTPWTLLANVAVAVHPSVDYVFFESGGEVYAAAEDLLGALTERLGLRDFHIITSKKGVEIEGLAAKHPFIEREARIICADYVSREEGTGFVHTAPGHGREDFEIGIKYNLPVLCPVDERGKFTAEAGEFEGLDVFEANTAVIEKLKSAGSLALHEELIHSYPICWRCKKPLIVRATEQWFISISNKNLREKLLDEIKKVKWIPAWGETRIRSMVAERPDWCISRQRLWGVPIPVFYCSKCGEVIASEVIMDKIKDEFKGKSSDVWFEKEPQDLAGGEVLCQKCGSSEIRKETDIFDVWFDSGVSSHAVLEQRESLGFPADLYLEGTDQHRGWFQTSLITSAAAKGKSPYKNVLTHGFMVDGEGKKMSKSVGNLIPAEELTKKYGADIMRLWVSAEDYRNDIRFSYEILSGISDSYRRFRNTVRYILGNLYDFDCRESSVPYKELPDMEKWVLHKLQIYIKTSLEAYGNFEFHKVYHAMHDFCAVTLSAFYFDIIKDRLYTSPANSMKRRASQTVLYKTLEVILKVMAPIIPHTCEEAWRLFEPNKNKKESIHLELMPEADENMTDRAVAEKWEIIVEARKVVNREIENARNAGLIGNTLQASVLLKTPKGRISEVLQSYAGELSEIFIVSEVKLEESGTEALKAEIGITPWEKCPRCWKYIQGEWKDKTQSGVCPLCEQALKGDIST